MFFKNNNEQYKDNVPRKWGLLPTLDYYILREFMMYFFLLIFVFIILFILGDVFNDLSDLLEKKAPFGSMLTYFMLKLPGNIRFILPISILLACMWTMANFGKHMEVTAMRASGVSLFRCGGPVLLVGLIVTGINFWFNEGLIPLSEKEAEIVFHVATKQENKLNQARNMLTYRSTDKRRTWLFNTFISKGKQQNVTLKNYREDGSLEWDIVAGSVSYDPKTGWTFENVTMTPYSSDGLMPKNPQRINKIVKGTNEISENPEDILNAIKAPDELPSIVIIRLLNKTKNMAERCRAMYLTILYYRMAFPWACFLAVFLGIPLATKNERSGIFMAIISAVVIIVAYQVTSEICLILGKRGILMPMIAGLGPTVAFIIFGWYNVVKQRS